MILAGGAGSRLGTEKALIEFGGRPLICWTVERLRKACEELVIVSRNKDQEAVLRELVCDAVFTRDKIQGFGPVAGLFSGLSFASGDFAFATGCDLPFLNVRAVEMLFDFAEGYDGAVPIKPKGFLEPLHAVYHREKMSLACKMALEKGERRIHVPLKMLDVNYVPVDLLRAADQQLLTIFNINTTEDLAEARRLWSKQ